ERDLAREQPARTPHELTFARCEPRTGAASRSRLAKMPVADDLGQADRVPQLRQCLAATLQPRVAAAGRSVAENLLDGRKPGLVDQPAQLFLRQRERKLHRQAAGQGNDHHRLLFPENAARLARLDRAGAVSPVHDDVADVEVHHLRGSAATADTSPCSSTETTSRRSPPPTRLNRRVNGERGRTITACTAVRVSIE